MEKDTPIFVKNTQIENAECFVLLGQRYSSSAKNQDNEVSSRITAGWTTFAKNSDNFKDNIGTCLMRQVYQLCVFPAMKNGAETTTLTTQAKRWKGIY